MTSIQLTQQNVSYHVFNINILCLSVNNNSLEVMLHLKHPHIIYNSYKDDADEEVLPPSLIIPPLQSDYNNVSNFIKQKTFHNIPVTKLLLHNKSTAKQKKRGRAKNHESHTPHLHPADSDTTLTESSNSSYNKKIDQKVTSVSDHTNLQNNSNSTIEINHPVTVDQLSRLINLPESEIIKFLFLKGISVTINQIISIDVATSIANTYGFVVVNNEHIEQQHVYNIQSTLVNKKEPRAPVLAILGDINNGKTALVSAIQNKQILTQKTHSMTQEIKAYEVDLYLDNITQPAIILDTPGHEAFVGMRSLSLQMADIAILVVDIITGLSIQGIQTLKDIISKQVPFVIVLTKIDMVATDTDILEQNVISHNIFPEGLKNKVSITSISSVTGKNINVLLSNIITSIKKLNLKASIDDTASGVIYNVSIDKSTGPTLSAIIENGTLYVGDIIVSGNTYGKVRVIKNYQNDKVKSSSFSSVTKISGLSKAPTIGHTFIVAHSEKEAKKIVKQFLSNKNTSSLHKQTNLETSYNVLGSLQKSNKTRQIRLVIKTDSQASIHPLSLSLSNIIKSTIPLGIISIGVGMINETDARLAIITKSLIIGFNTEITPTAQVMVKNSNLDVRIYTMINKLIDDIGNYTNQMSIVTHMKNYIGTVTVSSVFSLSTGVVAGCTVNSGKISKDTLVEILRDNTIIYEGVLSSMKHMKNDITEAKQGDKLGIAIADFNDWQVNDKIKVYTK